MGLPLGATKDELQTCINILHELTGHQETTELALDLLNIVYAKGGDYSEGTLRNFAEGYLKQDAHCCLLVEP